MNKQSNEEMLSKALMRGRAYWTSKEEIKKVLIEHLENRHLMPIGMAVRKDPKKVLSEVFEFMQKLAVHYPEEANRFLQTPINTDTMTPIEQPFFIGEVVQGICALHSDLLVEEVGHALHSGMLTYKYHTAPKVNDLIAMMGGYREHRLNWIEEHYNNRKKEMLVSPADNVIEALKKAQKEAAEELAEENRVKAQKELDENQRRKDEALKAISYEEAVGLYEKVSFASSKFEVPLS